MVLDPRPPSFPPGAFAPACLVPLWGGEAAVDQAALARLRTRFPDLQLFAVLLESGVLPDADVFDRVVRLPIGDAQRAYAVSIGQQLCFNEGRRQVGVLASLSQSGCEEASRHLERLGAGTVDAIIAEGETAADARLFLNERAAFLASLWSALGGALLDERMGIAAGLLALAQRTGLRFDGAYQPLPATDLTRYAAKADLLQSQTGLVLGPKPRLPRAPPVQRVAVATPYYQEPDAELARAIASVRAQTCGADHILVSDGFPNPLAAAPGLLHIELGVSHGDCGNTARYVAALVALARGYDAIAFLDADNWYEPKHVQRLVERQHETGATAVFSGRNIFLPDGHKVTAHDDKNESAHHVDTSCYMLTRTCEYASHLWGQMPREWGPACDRVLLAELAGQRLARSGNRTLNFKSSYAYHYQLAGRPIPENVHEVPAGLAQIFHRMPEEVLQQSVSRTGRVIRV